MWISIQDLVLRLQGIARKNDQQFSYSIKVEPLADRIYYIFSCKEMPDGHEVLRSAGVSIDDAMNEAWNCIPSMCQEWGWKE